MKTKELIKILQTADPNGEDNVAIALAQGIGGPRVAITGAYAGFDWYAGTLLLQTAERVVTEELYNRQADELKNHDRWIYLRVLPTETSNYFEGHLESYIGPRKPPFQAGDIIKARKVGQKDFVTVKILKAIEGNFLPRPQYLAILVEK